MFSPIVIAVALVLMFVSIGIIESLEKREKVRLVRAVAFLGLLACIVSVGAGLDMVAGWTDPLRSVDPETVQQFERRATARTRGRGGWIVLAIRYWPWFLIGAGGFFGLGYGKILWRYR